jgi:hypothetical protein
MSKKRSILLAVLLVMVMVIATAIPVAAATTATVTVTAVPAYISISTNSSWTINGIVGAGGAGSGKILTSTTYYSNYQGDTTAPSSTVAANECYVGLTNASNININVKADMANFTGGDAMTNGTGTAGANAFAAWVSEEGSAWSGKVQMDTTGSGTFWTSPSAGDDIGLVFQVNTQTGDWASATSQSSTITLTATAS